MTGCLAPAPWGRKPVCSHATEEQEPREGRVGHGGKDFAAGEGGEVLTVGVVAIRGAWGAGVVPRQ